MPNSRLNIGPPKQALSPIRPKPFLVIEMFDMRSPTELPNASTVRPSMKSLKLSIIPITCSRLICGEIFVCLVRPSKEPNHSESLLVTAHCQKKLCETYRFGGQRIDPQHRDDEAEEAVQMVKPGRLLAARSKEHGQCGENRDCGYDAD